jgi:hypothetical protein
VCKEFTKFFFFFNRHIKPFIGEFYIFRMYCFRHIIGEFYICTPTNNGLL